MSRSDYFLLAKAALIVIGFRVALHVLPFRTVARFAARGAFRRGSVDTIERERFVWAVNAVSRKIMPSRRCLVRALSVQWFLRRAGVPAELCIGARKQAAGRLNAHAWVELDGNVIIGGKDSPKIYAPFKGELCRV